MSERAYEYQSSRQIFTRQDGNITYVTFGRSLPVEPVQDEGSAAPDILTLYGDEQLSLFDQPAPEQSKAPTARQKELAKPDAKDMAVVPLESFDQVHGVINYFESQGNLREACLLVFGFCTGLRISDLLSLKIGDIVSSVEPLTFKAAIDIHEQKTGKRTVGHLDDMLITPAMQDYFSRYIRTKSPYERGMDKYLFTTNRTYGRKPMTIRAIQFNLAPAFTAICPQLHCSTHTMRKTFVSIIHTFASRAQMTGGGINPATACQVALRHANASTTLAYMGTMKSGMLSLRQAVSDFVQGKTKIKSLKTEYVWDLVDE